VVSIDIGPNLFQLLLALLAAIPGILAVYYARSAATQSAKTNGTVAGLVAKEQARTTAHDVATQLLISKGKGD
jgi:hypothetical protein